MTESQTTTNDPSFRSKKVSIQERSVLVGDLIVVNGYRVDRAALKQSFAEGGTTCKKLPISCSSPVQKPRRLFSCIGLRPKK